MEYLIDNPGDVNHCSQASGLRKYQSQSQRRAAEPWPCRPCGILLGIAHLAVGLVLMTYDVATDNLSESAFAISASITFIVCGILGLIASRRLDKGTITLWLIFSFMSLGLCLTMFVDSATQLNLQQECSLAIPNGSNVKPAVRLDRNRATLPPLCRHPIPNQFSYSIPHVVMLVISIVKLFIDLVTILISVRSLRNWYRPQLAHPESPYKAMIHSPLSCGEPLGGKASSAKRSDHYVTPYTRIMLENYIDEEFD